MSFPKLGITRVHLTRWVPFSAVATVLFASAIAVVLLWPQPSVSLAIDSTLPPKIQAEYGHVVKLLHEFESRQNDLHAEVVSKGEIERQLSVISLDAQSGHFAAARNDIRSLKQAVTDWNLELGSRPKPAAPVSSAPNSVALAAVSGVRLPILLYHYPPPDFEAQLVHLEQAGYTVIDLDQALAGLHGQALPAKPVVITFDDGFSAQMSAFEALKRHNMKATFYIIYGGEASRWCLGAGRRYNDPLQPPNGCGDGYLNWDQVRTLDGSGLITIAGHTINHRNLATLSEADQKFEIETGKAQLEAQLGHSVRHFAYPYGQYNGYTIKIVQEAGYLTAVTTAPGIDQTLGSAFTLRRVRNAFMLP
jgi:peptidoglycan/xylan/chitin deacetylase (PgdA/CDA1 family)